MPWPWRREIWTGSPKPKRRELVRELGPRWVVELVRHEQHGPARPAEDVRQLRVARRQPRAGVDEEEDEVGLLDGSPRLLDGAAS